MEDIYNYMIWGNYDQKITALAKMTGENWNTKDNTNNPILKRYLTHTTKKLEEEGKILTTDEYCIINTGLFTTYYEPIYIYAEKNYSSSDPDWFFKSFATPYDLGNLGITTLPERANYFQDPSLLIFNPNYKINVQFKHIYDDEDNRTRMPREILESKNIHSVFKGAIDTMIKKVTANYKIAVPQYFNGQIQLLLPLCLVDENKPDLALVVTRVNNIYQGHTCLTLEMAYNNARLIAKPESNWLVP
ncbi:DUF3825 domain-containing protein [Mediterraneibacter sp. NSJ-55]|uniref:DUF3825 domain-containing protein n=1 Tax=Mediterraneibacter hominis TaxID=2763054 RepID=A0A923RQ14_9FIRM|nr:DUF3825 domain-containing protein [Mediterraneibacter hominis]MBC5688188.1 DUF3825 domain-containing protein [Mediterraneibacter hominis]